MATDRDLPFPFAGRSDGAPKGDQDPVTCADAQNMRALDPASGRLQGAQRAGTRKLISASTGAGKVDFITEVGYQKDLVTFGQETSALSGAAQQVLTPGGGTVADLVTDRQDNVYGVDVLGEAIVVYTADMELTTTISLPMGSFDSVARSIAIDDQDRVYAAAGTSTGPPSGAIWRFIKKGDRWVLDWEFEAEGDVVKLEWRSGVLCAALNARDDDEDFSQILYFTTLTDTPTGLWDRSTPYPVGDVALDALGNVLYTAPWNKERDTDEDGFGVRSVDWTPYDLTNANGDADERLYFWVAADHLSGFSTGDKIRHWPDVRNDHDQWVGNGFSQAEMAIDDTDRYMQHRPGRGWNSAAKYDAKAFGTMPGIKFNGSKILRSRGNYQAANKSAVNSKLKKNRGPIPGVDVATWATVLLVRITPSDDPSPIFGVKGPLNLGLIANGKAAMDPTIAAPDGDSGTLQIYAPDTTGLTTDAVSFESDTNCVIVTITHDGVSGGAARWRVNGLDIDAAFTWTEDRLFAAKDSSASVLMGMPRLKEEGAGTDPFGSISGLAGFQGAIAEWVTVLGTTVTNPHDTAVTLPDIELVEGYLAYKYGLQGSLPVAHAYDEATGGPTGGAWTNATTLSEDQLALFDRKSIVAKFKASGGDVAWAYNEFVGAGEGIAAGPVDEVYTMGARPVDLDTGEVVFINDAGFSVHEVPLVRKAYDDGLQALTGTASTAVLTITAAANAGDGDTVTIDGEVYTFRASLTPGQSILNVAVGASAGVSLENLCFAVSATGIPGTHYGDGVSTGDQRGNHLGYLEYDTASQATFYTHIRGDSADGATLSTDVTNWAWGGTTAGGDAATTWSFSVGSGVFWWPFNWADIDTLSDLKVGPDGRLYLTHPSAEDDLTSGTGYPATGGLSCIDEVGGTDGTTSQNWWWNSAYTGGSTSLAHPYNAVAMGYQPDYGAQTTKGPEFIYLAATGHKVDTTGDYNLHKIRVVTQTRTGETSARGFRRVVINSGDIKTWTPDSTALVIPANGTGALYATPRRVVGANLYGRVYLSDGDNAKFLDARENRVATWVAEKGKLPARIEQLARWRARIVAVSADDPHNWHMSRLGDAFDWDEYPEVITAEQAVSGNNPAALGRLAEPIQALISYSDDTLILGCQDSIHVMQGDPMAVALGGYGGKIVSLLTDEQGVAPGTAWTKDPSGNVYMLGSRGSLLRMPPGGGIPQDISSARVRRELEDIDFSTYWAALSWNYKDRGLHVFLMPWGASGSARSHWFWEEVTGQWKDGGYGSFWPDKFNVNPSAVAQFNGDDPDDRLLVIGGEDGHLRKWVTTARSDDGERIYSQVLMGPYVMNAHDDVRVTRLEVLLSDKAGGCSYELYVSSTPTLPESSVASGEFDPGLNVVPVRVRSAYVWLRLGNGASTESWAVENVKVQVAPAGRRRRR